MASLGNVIYYRMKISKTEYWAMKGNELWIHMTTWINLKSMRVREARHKREHAV